jgi:hypothetical protein
MVTVSYSNCNRRYYTAGAKKAAKKEAVAANTEEAPALK